MRVKLFPFQETALDNLKHKIASAQSSSGDGDPQVICFSSPTGSGKTIVMISLFEDLLFGSEDVISQPDAVIIWLSDMPELNEQTRLKIETKSDKIRSEQLISVDSTFDEKYLEGGNIYFLNTQKLGTDKLLTQKSETRQYTIWETLTNTAKAFTNRFYIIIDEAHRGMNSLSGDANQAQSIMQKFLIGSENDGLCRMPLVIGITATPQRFLRLLSGTTSTVHNVVVSPKDVRESGLLKDRVIIYYPKACFDADLAMFKGAVENWIRKTSQWKDYCEHEDEKLVKPILVVQVEDGNKSTYTRTDIQRYVEVLQQSLGRTLNDGEIGHTFHDKSTLNINGVQIAHIEASRIEGNDKIIVILFKMNLSTGWDCPRAEVMMSFRKAEDYTFVAQLLGRMVRTPLARRIELNEELNNISLFLPYYDERTVSDVISALSNGEDVIPAEMDTSRRFVSLKRNPNLIHVFSEMENLITYKMDAERTQKPLKRLLALARALTQDAIALDALSETQSSIVDKMNEEVLRLKKDGKFDTLREKILEIDINTVTFDFREENYGKEVMKKYTAAEMDIDRLFNDAGKTLGDGLHKSYWKRHCEREDIEVKVEVIILVHDVDAMKRLNDLAISLFDSLYSENRKSISKLKEARRNVYQKTLLSLGDAVAVPWQLPEVIEFSLSDTSVAYDKHLFVEESGKFQTDLNTWERDIVLTELEAGTIAWLRNLDRKPWSFAIPYEKAGTKALMYPDIVVVKKHKDGYVFDILEPHDPTRSDNFEKAKGLALFASKHWNLFGRIQLIRKMKSADGNDHYLRLDMSVDSTRSKVRSITDNNALDDLFRSSATV